MTDRQIKALYIARQLLLDGFTLAGAAGAIANIEAESAFKSTNVQDTYERGLGMNDEQYTVAVDAGYYTAFESDQAGYGLCQWTERSRKRGMLNYHRARGKSIGDFECQVDWMKLEIRSFAHPYAVCRESNDPYTCGYVFCMEYEIPENKKTKAEYRGGLAQEWYAWLQTNIDAPTDGQDTNVPTTPEPQPSPNQQRDVLFLQLAMQEDGDWDKPIDGLNTAEWRTRFRAYAEAVLGGKIQ